MLKKYSVNLIILLGIILLSTKVFLSKFFPGDNLIGLYHPFRDLFSNIYPSGFPYKNPLITDPFLQIFPWKYLSLEALKNLSLPLWNPYSFSGYPLLANFQSGSFFPINILLFIPGADGWQAFIFMQIPLSLIAMYVFLSKLSVSKLPAIFGAICYSMSGFAIGWLEWGNIGYIFGLLPLSLYFIVCLTQKKSLKNSIFLFLSVWMLGLAGHLQLELYSLCVIFSFIAFKFLSDKKSKQTLYIAAICVLAIFSTSFQLIPTLEFINNSYRTIDIGYTGQADWFIPYRHLISLIAPDFFGSPARLNYWGVWNHLEFNLSISVAGIIFAFFGLKLKKISIYFTLVLILALIFATKNPISELIYTKNVPFLSSAQPSRLIFVISFCLSVLSALGLDVFYKLKISSRKIIAISIIVILTFVIIYLLTVMNFQIFSPIDVVKNQPTALRNLILPTLLATATVILLFLSITKIIPRKISLLVFIAITTLELLYAANKFLPVSNDQMFYPQTKTTKFITHDNSIFRISTTDDRIFPPNISAMYGIQSVDGYDPLYPKNYAELIAMIEMGNENPIKFNRIVRPKNINSNLFSLLNVKYVLGFENEINKQKPVFQEGSTNTFINSNFLPRVFTVSETIHADNTVQSRQKMLNVNFDPKSQAVVIGGVDKKFTQAAVQPFSPIISYYSANKLIIETENNEESFLVLLDNFFPGWKAKVNGQKTTIFQTDHSFRGVYLPSGKNEIIFEYRPSSFYAGIIVSLFSLLILTVLVIKFRYETKN